MDYSFFEHLKNPREKLHDEHIIKKKLVELLDKAVKSLVRETKILPIAFSGGLDSSILAYLASKYTKPILFCVGFKDSYDIANAQKSAKISGLNLKIILLDGIDFKKYRDKVVGIIGTSDQLQIELGLPLLVLCESLWDKGYKHLMTGQGMDTLFGGFDKYLRSKNLEEDIFQATKNMYDSNLKRDLNISQFCGVSLILPCLEEEFVKFALKIPADLKIKKGIRKYILREAFREILPREILEQNKKALQYGSGVHKAFKLLKCLYVLMFTIDMLFRFNIIRLEM